MESEIKQTTSIILKLTDLEARWLKGIMQNPIRDNYDDEDAQDKAFREKFWDALPDIQ